MGFGYSELCLFLLLYLPVMEGGGGQGGSGAFQRLAPDITISLDDTRCKDQRICPVTEPRRRSCRFNVTVVSSKTSFNRCVFSTSSNALDLQKQENASVRHGVRQSQDSTAHNSITQVKDGHTERCLSFELVRGKKERKNKGEKKMNLKNGRVAVDSSQLITINHNESRLQIIMTDYDSSTFTHMSQKDEVGLTQAGNLTWKLTPPQRHAGYFKPEWLGVKRKLFPHSVCVCVNNSMCVC